MRGASVCTSAFKTGTELADIDRSQVFTIADVEQQLKRAGNRDLEGWGKAVQNLPPISWLHRVLAVIR
jgi:hypothetical protein